MSYYLRYMTPGGRVKERFFPSRSAMQSFILASRCTLLEWREL